MTAPAGDVILEAVGLERRFTSGGGLLSKRRTVRAVEGVDLAVARGETLAIVGESGCGKSTLARALAHLLPPTGGKVAYEGRDIARASPAERRRLRRELQFIFQDPFASLNPRMTVGALIEEPLKVHGLGSRAERRAQAAALLDRVGLSPAHANRYPHAFSGGQRQRIGIARALACKPKILVGDEPVSALDVSIQAQVVNLLQDLKADFGLTLIVIAHDLSVIRHMADRVAVMYLGKIVELGPVEELFTTPRHPYTEALLASIPIPAMVGKKPSAVIEGDLPDPANPPSGCRFHTRCAHANRRCAREVPKLADPWAAHQVACRRADALSLAGIPASRHGRSSAAEARFETYRTARALET